MYASSYLSLSQGSQKGWHLDRLVIAVGRKNQLNQKVVCLDQNWDSRLGDRFVDRGERHES